MAEGLSVRSVEQLRSTLFAGPSASMKSASGGARPLAISSHRNCLARDVREKQPVENISPLTSCAAGRKTNIFKLVAEPRFGAKPDESGGTASGHSNEVRDNFIPVFDGRPNNYKEYRMRIMLYYRKMSLQNRKSEATINLLTSLSGTAWKNVEHMVDTVPDAENGFEQVVAQLDLAFKYDDRVEMPRTFERFFYNLSRKPHQNLLAYCTEHREHLREVERHKVVIPPAVSSWLLLRRAGLTAEQRQLVLGQVGNDSSLEKMEGDYTGKDKHNHAQRWIPQHGRGHYQWNNYRKPATYDDELYHEDTYSDEEDVYWEDEDNITYPDQPTEEEQPQDFNEEIYFDEDHEYTYDEDEEEAYATYIDARKKLAEHRSARGYYPVVALTDTNALPAGHHRRDLHHNVLVMPFHLAPNVFGAANRATAHRTPSRTLGTSGRNRPTAWTAYLEDHVDQPYITGMQDGGASGVLCGHDVLMQLLVKDAIHHDLTFDYMTNDVVTDVHQHLLQLYTLEDIVDTGCPGPILPEIAQHVDCTTTDNLPSDDAPDFNLHEGVTEPVLGDIPNKIWRSFDVALATWHNHVNFHLNQATKHKPDGKKVFWEVYAGEGNLSRAMADCGWIVRTFDLPEWDFTKSHCTKAFYQVVSHAEHQSEQRGGRQAYIEQPLWSLAWNTTAFQLDGHRAIFDQCAYGAGFWTSATVWNNIRKPTAVLSTEPIFAEILSLKCPGNHTHVYLQGHCPGIGSLTTAAAAYQPSMCEAISDAICTSAEQIRAKLMVTISTSTRRALLRQYRGNSEPLTIGMKVYYWRDAAGTGPKIKWEGPATIVMVETDNETGKPRCYWNHHLHRPLVSDDEDVNPDPKRPSPDHEPLVDYWEPAQSRVHQFPRHQLFCPSPDDPDIPYHRLGSLWHTEIYRLASDTGLPALEAEHRNDDWHQPFNIQHPWIGRTRFVVVNNEGDVTMGKSQETISETADYAFKVDIVDDTSDTNMPLPPGWHADASGHVVLDTIHDDWTLSKNGNYLIRNHCIPRNTLFDPSEDGNCPIPLPMLHKSRTTRFADGQSRQDRWRCRSNHLDEQIYWTGRTSFKIQPRDRVRAHEHFFNTSEGHQTYAGSPQQRKKDSKNLSERTMSLADQQSLCGSSQMSQKLRHSASCSRAAILSIAANNGWGTFTADISTAFLQGFIVALMHKDAIEKGFESEYHILDWRSFRLPRVARSTLAAESQAAAEAADALTFAPARYISLLMNPNLKHGDPMLGVMNTPATLAVDAKALYDLLEKREVQASLGSDKRTAIEVIVTKDAKKPDGLTKVSAAQLLADRLRLHRTRLVDTRFPARQHTTSTASWVATTLTLPTIATAHSEEQLYGSDYVLLFLPLMILLIGILMCGFVMTSHFRTHGLTEAQRPQERIHQLVLLSDEKAYVKSTEEALIEAQDKLKAMHESANIAAGEIMRLRQENRQQHRDLRMTEGALRDATTSAIYLCR
ncbi:unnamed protein product, partial [Effrenium voratum]